MNFVYNDSAKVYTAGFVKLFNGEWRNNNFSSLKEMEVQIHDCGFSNASTSTIFRVELVIRDKKVKGSLSCFIYDGDVGEVVSSEIQLAEFKGWSNVI